MGADASTAKTQPRLQTGRILPGNGSALAAVTQRTGGLALHHFINTINDRNPSVA
jgi:hypothetical protein